MFNYFSVDFCLAKLIDGPKSTSALLGEVASFNCSAFGPVFWLVNGLQADHPSVKSRGITTTPSITSTNGSVLSLLSVSATAENNNVTIVCIAVLGFSVEVSANAILTVLGKLHFAWLL